MLVASSAVRTCFGDGAATFAALLEGRCGVRPLDRFHGPAINVAWGYGIADDAAPHERWLRASRWLADCVRAALAEADVDPAHERVVVIVGTGLRELRAVERAVAEATDLPAEWLHFGAAIRRAAPHIGDVITVSNACSAGGHALALAQDLIELGEADVAVAAGTDAMTESMLAMIGRFTSEPTDRVRPFDCRRRGVLLGEGAVAQVVVPEDRGRHALARVLSTGLSCDAFHETAPSADGVWRAMHDAFGRASRSPAQVDLVVAHGTGTALNDPLEATVLQRLFGSGGPLVTAVKGALGHTSGTAALVNVDVAIRCMRTGLVPPVVGLGEPVAAAASLRLVREAAVQAECRLTQVDAFGFGGVNAVTLLEAA